MAESIEDILRSAILDATARRTYSGVKEWAHAQRVRIASSHNRTYAGEIYNFDRFPCISSLVFGFLEDRNARELILMKDVQSTASTCALFGVAWMLANDPGNVIFITDTRDQMRDFAKDRIDPIFSQVPSLCDSQDATETGSTELAKRFSGGILYLGGGQSTTGVISKPAGLMILDEVAKHPLVKGMTTIALARGRGTGDAGAKLFAFSTPDDEAETETDPVTGKVSMVMRAETVIHAEYLTGTREVCEVPCPHCKTYQPLEFENLQFAHCKEDAVNEHGEKVRVWNKARVAKETWYRCAHCAGKIEERHKADMIPQCRWVVTNPNPHPGRRSAHISALYNTAFASRRWGNIALAFLDAVEKGDSASMKAFHTEYLGKAFARFRVDGTLGAKAKSLIWTRLRRKNSTGNYRFQIPAPSNDIRLLGMSVDVQKGFIKYLISAILWDGRILVLDWGRENALEDIPALLEERIYRAEDADESTEWGWGVSLVYIDVGHDKERVFEFIADMGGDAGDPRWEGIRGAAKTTNRKIAFGPHWRDTYPVRDAMDARQVRVNWIDSDYWETELYVERIANHEPGVYREDHPPICLPADSDSTLLAEVNNMHQVFTRPNKYGYRELTWQKIRATPNDFGDLLKYTLVMEYVCTKEDLEAARQVVDAAAV